ncbi:unnamed protein product, partial [Durusdinium trenchii]
SRLAQRKRLVCQTRLSMHLSSVLGFSCLLFCVSALRPADSLEGALEDDSQMKRQGTDAKARETCAQALAKAAAPGGAEHNPERCVQECKTEQPHCHQRCAVRTKMQMVLQMIKALTKQFKPEEQETCSVSLEVPISGQDREKENVETSCPKICTEMTILESFEHSFEKTMCADLTQDQKHLCSVIIEPI